MTVVHGITLTPFVEAYITAALWSTNDESNEQGGEPLDRNYTVHDIHPDTLRKMVEDCERFQQSILADDEALYEVQHKSSSDAGHDFWLTRQRSGAGFQDGHWKNYGNRLADRARIFSEFNLYVGDDGMIHGQ